jgi:Membrane protein involved in the export of O-antigen and teichoic acid
MENKENIGEQIARVGISTASMSSYLLIGKLFAFLVAGISLVVVARILGPSGYGIYVVAIAVAGIAGSVGNFGIGTALTKFISEYKSKKANKKIDSVLSNGIFILAVVGGVFTIVTFLFSGVAALYALHGSQYVYVIQTASLIIVVSILSGALYSALIGFGYGKYSAAYSIFEIVVQSAVSITLAMLGYGPISPVIGVIFGQSAGFAFALYAIYGRGKNGFVMPTAKGIRKLFAFAWPVAASNFFSSIINDFSVIFLGIFVASSIVGNFGLASRTNFLGDIVVGSIGLAILPSFTRLFSAKRTREDIGRFYNMAIYISMVVVSPFMFFLIFFAKPVSYLAFGSSYSLAPLYIAVAAAGIVISIFGNYSGTMLISDNRTRDIMRYRMYMFVIQLALMFVLIYLFGGLGLAILVFLVGPLLQAFFYIRRIRMVYKIKTNYNKAGRALLSNALSFFLVWAVLFWLGNNYLYQVPAAIVGIILVYPIVLTMLKGIERADSKMMKDLSKNIPIVGKLLFIILSYAEAFMR